MQRTQCLVDLIPSVLIKVNVVSLGNESWDLLFAMWNPTMQLASGVTNGIHLDCVKSCRLSFTSVSVSRPVPTHKKIDPNGLRKFSGKENGIEFKPKSLLV